MMHLAKQQGNFSKRIFFPSCSQTLTETQWDCLFCQCNV